MSTTRHTQSKSVAEQAGQAVTRDDERPADDASSETRMRSALARVVTVGPGFLCGTVPADDMASLMVRTVREYAAWADSHPQHPSGRASESTGHDARELVGALNEVYTCGSGYLAGRCDADCVMRTMTDIVEEFADLDPAR